MPGLKSGRSAVRSTTGDGSWTRWSCAECVAEAGLGLGGPELASAERSGRALTQLAPYRESGHRLLMKVFAASGNVAEAIRVYEVLCCRLRNDLGIVPSPETRELHRGLLA